MGQGKRQPYDAIGFSHAANHSGIKHLCANGAGEPDRRTVAVGCRQCLLHLATGQVILNQSQLFIQHSRLSQHPTIRSNQRDPRSDLLADQPRQRLW